MSPQLLEVGDIKIVPVCKKKKKKKKIGKQFMEVSHSPVTH